MPECSVCGISYGSRRQLNNHYYSEHGGELWPDNDDLPDNDSEQRDFAGEEPTTDGHNPEYIGVEDPPETERTRLEDWE